jgi:hypothetical protein
MSFYTFLYIVPLCILSAAAGYSKTIKDNFPGSGSTEPGTRAFLYLPDSSNIKSQTGSSGAHIYQPAEEM